MQKIDIQRLHVRTRGISEQQARGLVQGLPKSILREVMSVTGSVHSKGSIHIPALRIRPIRISRTSTAQDFHRRAVSKINRGIIQQIDSKP